MIFFQIYWVAIKQQSFNNVYDPGFPKKKMTAEDEKAFKYVHSGLLLSLGRHLFLYEAGIANSYRLLHF